MGSQKSSPSNVTLNKIIEIQLSHLCALKLTSKNPCFFIQGVGKGMWSSLVKAMMPMGCPKQKNVLYSNKDFMEKTYSIKV